MFPIEKPAHNGNSSVKNLILCRVFSSKTGVDGIYAKRIYSPFDLK